MGRLRLEGRATSAGAIMKLRPLNNNLGWIRIARQRCFDVFDHPIPQIRRPSLDPHGVRCWRRSDARCCFLCSRLFPVRPRQADIGCQHPPHPMRPIWRRGFCGYPRPKRSIRYHHVSTGVRGFADLWCQLRRRHSTTSPHTVVNTVLVVAAAVVVRGAAVVAVAMVMWLGAG